MAGGAEHLADLADDGDEDAAADAHGPLRRCIVTGERLTPERLIRFVVGPGDTVVPDLAATLPGRGIWLSARRDVVNTAGEKNFFARAARRKVIVPPGLADVLEAQIVRRCMDTIGLARRAGQAILGFEKAAAGLRAGRGGVLIAARDAGADGQAKLRALAPDLPRFTLLDAAELGVAVGRDHLVHAVVAAGALADRLLQEQARLEGFRDAAPAGSPHPQTD